MAAGTIFYSLIDESPIGALLIAGTEAGLRSIDFLANAPDRAPDPAWRRDDQALADAVGQLRAYFAGELRQFNLPLAATGTTFQRAVWDALVSIPYGVTISYGELARMIGNPDAVRAVGAANGRNPLPIVVPCHRVIGGDGTLVGYAGGMRIKETLLALEGAWRPAAEQLTLL
jgi:methylated-DNA-[protein]-cysteine S-methyltransferase